MTQTMNSLVRLHDLAVVCIDGEDAVDFLHTQLSNDISGMGADDARLAGYCSPKGRMLGSLIVWNETGKAGDPLLALVKADILDSLLKRLRMFVLRAKVRLEVTDLAVYGACFQEDAEPPSPWQVSRDDDFTRISAPVALDGPSRAWIVCNAQQDAETLASSLGLNLYDDHGPWYAQDVKAGLGWVEQANVELFIPQSLSYDLIGGVSFTKGCYPGQEVVARAHFRGAVKRRAVPGYCQADDAASLQAGADIFDAQRPRSPAGRIINAARADRTGEAGSGWHVLLEVNLSDIGQADFRALSADGPSILLLPLPYELEAKDD